MWVAIISHLRTFAYQRIAGYILKPRSKWTNYFFRLIGAGIPTYRLMQLSGLVSLLANSTSLSTSLSLYHRHSLTYTHA